MDVNKLYLVGPVGEWQDLTLRAREVLRRARLIVVCDASRVRPDLDQVGVRARLLESGRQDALAEILSALAEGEVAWLAMRLDELAGPAQSLARALLDQGVELVSVPGASATVSGLVASGLPADRFTALGLLPTDAAKRLSLWPRVVHDPMTVVCEVWAEDLDDVLGEVLTHLGDRRIAVCQGNDVWRGQVSEYAALDWEGCVTLAIEDAGSEPDWSQDRVLGEARALLDAGASPSDASRQIARLSGWPRRQVYELVLSISRDE